MFLHIVDMLKLEVRSCVLRDDTALMFWLGSGKQIHLTGFGKDVLAEKTWFCLIWQNHQMPTIYFSVWFCRKPFQVIISIEHKRVKARKIHFRINLNSNIS